jgi:hypothetical protein
MTAKADRVRHLLENEDLAEAFDNVRIQYFELFEKCPLGNEELRRDIHYMLTLLAQVKGDLYNAIENGNYEDHLANQSEQPAPLGEIKQWPRRQ